MKRIALAITVILLLLALGVTIPTLFVQAEAFNITINVSSPIQNETYFTNDIPLSFSYTTNIINSSDVIDYTVVFCYILDGQPRFEYGRLIPSGETTRIGEFFQPVPLDYNLSIHVPNGNHSLFVWVTFWIIPSGGNQNMLGPDNVSKVVNFTVSAETPTSTPSPSPTPSPTPEQTLEPTQSPEPQPEPFPTTLVLAAVSVVAIVCIGLFVYIKKRK
jgi:hypothetical protein